MNLEALDLLVRTVAYPVSAAICLNQVEELFIDASYFARGLHRRPAGPHRLGSGSPE